MKWFAFSKILLRYLISFPFAILILFHFLMHFLANFNTFSRSWKPILKFNTFSIPRGNPKQCNGRTGWKKLCRWPKQAHLRSWKLRAGEIQCNGWVPVGKASPASNLFSLIKAREAASSLSLQRRVQNTMGKHLKD